MIEFQIKPFKTLSNQDIYQILQLRSEVFVVEQNCVYQDIDGKDQKALHVLGFQKDVLVAYARIFAPKDYFEFASIGRVIVKQNFRDKKYGVLLMQTAINAVQTHYQTKQITIHAQQYLQKFYESFGFVQTSEMFLEDNIPHIEMKLV
jgi:ElaA protein